MADLRPLIFDLDPQALRERCQAWGWPTYRATQLLEWVYQRHELDPMRMTNLAQAERVQLATLLRWGSAEVVAHQHASDGTQKLLLQWDHVTPAGGSRVSGPEQESGIAQTTQVMTAEQPASPLPVMDASRQTECVMIPNEDLSGARRTACVSSQVGCPVGCRFCASGLGGLDGNLTRGQIVEQVWRLGKLAGVERISHVVFMGMGEPLSNFEEVTAAIRTLTAAWGLGISARRITVSTVGLPAQIRRLTQMDLPITLAISLHAPNDELRRQVIPWAEYVSIEQILEAGRFYFQQTGREITLEYILLGRVNDQVVHARELSQVAKKLRANVNLIRYNEVKGLPYHRPEDEDVRAFESVLRQAGVNTHIRASRGRDIAAACGQLRHEQKQ